MNAPALPTPATAPAAGHWWNALYDDLLAELLLVREDAEDEEDTVRFLVERLELAPGARTFDQCCGIGSLAIPLARRGFSVVGVDQAARYIERGRRDAAGLPCELHTGDAFDFVPDGPVHGAFNWWTSFGYTGDDRENVRMLARAFDALVPGGRFALDTLGLPGVLRGFQPQVVTRKTTEDGEIVLLRESTLDLPAGFMKKTWTYFLPNGRRVTHESRVRLYMPHSLAELMRSVGFEDVTFHGGVRGEPLDLDARRCIVVGRRPR
jgi:SAM-dependent methyltransferase